MAWIGNAMAAVAPPTFGDVTIYLAQDPVDFRLGINGLSVLVEATLRFDPFSRNLFCFVNKRRTQIKVLYWQRSGFCLWLKRLEEERFGRSRASKTEAVHGALTKIARNIFSGLRVFSSTVPDVSAVDAGTPHARSGRRRGSATRASTDIARLLSEPRYSSIAPELTKGTGMHAKRPAYV